MCVRKLVPLSFSLLAGLGLTACSGGDTGTAAPGTSASAAAECGQEDRKVLDSSPILEVVPPGARQVDRYQECDGAAAYAGRFYQTGQSPAHVVAFYQERLAAGDWRIRSLNSSPGTDPTAGGDDLFCATTSIGGATAYLELWYPDEDSGLLGGRAAGSVYALDLSRESRTTGSVTPDC